MRPSLRPLRRHSTVLLAFWLALAACAPPPPGGLSGTPLSVPAALRGRWQRLDSGLQTTVGDPLQTLAQPVLELRDQGQLAALLVDGANSFTTMTGAYALLDTDHLRIDGRCWQGYASHACSQTYRFNLAGDHLTLFGADPATGQLDYQRLGPAAASLPPTLVPPMPSAAP